MSHPTDDGLAAHLLGEEDHTAHLSTCAECTAQLDALARGLLQSVGQQPPPPLHIADEARFFPFVQRLEALWQLSNAGVKAVLARAAHAHEWIAFTQGCRLFHLQGGPALQDKDVGIVEIPEGGSFAMHAHTGHEEVLVLQGGFVDSASGETFRAGDHCATHMGEAHALRALPGESCMYAVVTDPVEFTG